MKLNRLLLGLLVASTLLFTACPDEVEEITVDEAKTELTQNATQMAQDLSEMLDTTLQGTATLMHFIHMMDNTPQKSFSSYARVLKQLLKPTFIGNSLKDLPEEELELLYGTYEWNSTNMNWDANVGTPADKWIFKFPATEESQTNNAILTLDMDGQMYGYEFMPTMIEGSIVVDDIKYVEVSATASWMQDGEGAFPTSISGTVYNKPFSLTANLTYSETTLGTDTEMVIAGDFELKKDGNIMLAADIDISLIEVEYTETYDGYTETYYETIPKLIDGFVRIYDFKIDGTADLTSLIGMEGEPTEAQINEAINFDLLYVPANDMKIADIYIAENPAYNEELNNEEMPIIIKLQFTDGTEENFLTYFGVVLITIMSEIPMK